MYDFAVKATHKVIDGDTVDVVVDVGFRATLVQRIRLAVIDTPERGLPGWGQARMLLTSWMIAHSSTLRLRTYKEDSFGRWIADIYDSVSGTTASSVLLENGLAEVWR